MHLYCLRRFYIEIIVIMVSFRYHFIPASLPTRKVSELQKLEAIDRARTRETDGPYD